MRIIADENIPCVAKAFASLGEVTLLPGRGMSAAQVRGADILLVRSVTRVDARLLAGSSVQFVGSATIGFDHVDREYLQQQGIGFSTAPGSNATSAAEYVVSALLALSAQQGFDPAGRTVGIIGCGNVGSRVRQKLVALGMDCLVNDPPLQAQGGHEDFVDLDAVLQADVITVHVPYIRQGPWPTHHLVDAAFLARLRPGTVFINTARGAVTDNLALDRLLASRSDLSVVLDVWEGEPDISMSLLEKVRLGTPHIAGYSLDGKLRGTEMIYHAACAHFGQPIQWLAADDLPAGLSLDLRALQETPLLAQLQAAVFTCYDIRRDDASLRELLALPAPERPGRFDRLRKEYPVRREFPQARITTGDPAGELASTLSGLGFCVAG
jgi:erythronate-4-phosphate dehydrogenase